MPAARTDSVETGEKSDEPMEDLYKRNSRHPFSIVQSYSRADERIWIVLSVRVNIKL